MPRFAANLSMMFNEVPFLDRFAAARKAGFEGVEFLFPYEYPAAEIRARGRQVIFVGGTPLYLKGLLRGIFEGPPADWQFRDSLLKEAETSLAVG